MNRKLKVRINSFIIISIYIFFTALAVYMAIYDHSFELLTFLGFFFGILLISIVLNWGTPSFGKMMKSLPGDHKLVTGHIAAIDIGNFRFLYRVYVKSMGPAAKSYVSMEVGVPFPEEEVEKGEYTARESIKWELQTLIDNLLEEGILTDYSPIVQENTETEDAEALQGEEATHITWLGQVMRLEFLQKSISAEKLAEVQGKILGIIDKYRLQDVSWCVRCARDYGSEYRYYKGNLLQSTVWYRHPLDMGRSDYKLLAQLYTGADESLCAVDVYLDKYQMALRSLGKDDIKMSDVRKRIKQMFKGKKMNVDVMEDTDEISVNVSTKGAASTYHLVHLEDRWWVYAEGRLDAFPPISLDDESSACDALLRYLQEQAV